MLKLKVVKEKEKIDNSWSIERVALEYPPFTWEKVFESAKDEIKDVSDILEKRQERIVPNKADIFKIFDYVPIHKVKVVIFGQDPFINLLKDETPQARGIAFSVSKKADIPPSLKNIYKELQSSVVGFKTPSHGDLSNWVFQGVFLLNSCLTTKLNESGSHGEIWHGLIKKVINAILDVNPDVVFVMWGKEAQKMKKIIGERATCLESSHPSPLGCYRGFLGCNHFNLINEHLVRKGKTPIDWNL